MPAPAPGRISIVEDDLSLLHALAFALEAEGYAVTLYSAGAEAIQRPPDGDCLVVDLKLPDMDGLALIGELRRLGKQPPAILITTNPDDRCRRQAAKLGVPIVEKPLIGGELRLRIAQVIAANAV